LLPVRLDSEAEIAVLGKAVERMLLPLVRAAIPELIDYALPVWGGGDRFAFLAIRKTIPLQARRAASALWGLPAFQSTKFVVLVDEDVDVQDFAQVWSRVGANVDPGRLHRRITPLLFRRSAAKWGSTPPPNCPAKCPPVGPPNWPSARKSATWSIAAGKSMGCSRSFGVKVGHALRFNWQLRPYNVVKQLVCDS
jgi:hypothetical protein